MTTTNNQEGNPKEFAPGSIAGPPAGPPPGKPVSKLRRWLKLGFLGVVLSGIYIAYNLSLMTLPIFSPEVRPARGDVDGTSFKLADEKLQRQLIAVIQSQLTAFRQEDYSTAYTYAAAEFKAQVSLAAFERMVKAAFPQLARSRSAEYGIVMENGDIARVEVTIVGESGARIHCQYILHREGGGWKIGGVNEGQPEKAFI